MEVIPRPQQTDNNANQELQESHLRSLPSFINLQYTFQTQTREYFVLDHVDSQRNLASMYKSHGPFRHDVVVFLAAELLIALEYLHAHNTVYCELNMKKVFIDVQGHVKLSRTMSNPFQWTGDECFYCNSAQSNCQNEHHGSALVSKEDICHDWVTLGGLLCKLLTGKCPLSDVSKEGRNERRGSLATFCLPLDLDDSACDLIRKLLDYDYHIINVTSLKTHSFFTGTDWKKAFRRELPPPEIFCTTSHSAPALTTQEDENTTLNSVGIDGDGSVVAHKASLEDLHRITRCLSENDGASCDSASQENSEPDKNMNLVETKIPTKFSKIPRWSIKRKSRSVSETIHKESNAKSSTSNNSKAPLKSTRNSSSNHSHTTKAHEQDTKDVSTNCTVAEKQKINESFAGPGTDSHNMAFASNFDSRLLSPIISEKSAPFESLKFRNDKIGNLETSPVGTFSEGFHPSRSTLLCPRENNTCRNDNHGSPESKSDPVFYPRFTRSYSDIDLFGGKDRQSENFSSSERHNRSYTTPESAFSSQYRPLFTKRNNGLYGETNEKEAMGSRIYIGKDSGLLATKINFSVPCYELKYNSPYTYNDRIGHSSHVGGETNQHRRNDSSSFRTGSSPSSNEYRPQFDAVGISVPHTTPGSNPNKEVSRDTRFVNGQFESMLQSKPNMYGRHYNEEEHVTDPSYTQTPPVLLGGLGRSHSHIGSFSSEPRLESTASDETTSDYKSPLLERACKLLESNFVDWRTSSSIRPNVSGYSNTSEQHWDSKALTRSYPNFRPSTFSHQPVVKPTIGNRRSSLESPSAFRLSLSSGAVPSPIEKDSSTVFTSKSGVVESVLSPRYNEPASSIRNDSNYIAAATPSNNSDSTATKSRIPVNSKDSLQMCRGSSLQYKISDNEALRKIKQGAYLQGMKKMPFSSTSVSPLSGSNDEAQRGGRDSDSYTEKTSPRVEKLQQQLISYQERRKRIDKEYDERRLLRKVNAVSKGANDNTQKRNIPASYQGSGSDDLIQCYDRSLSDGTTQYHNQSSTHDNSGFRDDFEQNSTSTTNEFVSASLQYKNLEDKGMDSKPQAVSSKISSLQEKTTSEVFRSGLLTEYSINPKSEEILYDTNISLDAFQGHNIHRESDNISENVTNPIIKSKGDNVKKSAKGIISNSLPTSKQTIAPNASTTTRRFETPDKATRIAGSDSVCNRSQRNSSHTCVHTHPRSKLTGHTLDGRTQDAKPVSNSKLKYPSKRQIEVQSGQERLDSNHPHLMRTVSESCNTPEANKVRPKMKKAVSEQSLSVLPTKRQRRKKTVDKSNTLSNDDVNIQSVKGNKLTENHKASDKTREKSNSDKGASKGPSIETSSPSRGQSRIPVLRRAVSEEHIKIDRQQNSYSESSENSKMRIAMSSKAIVNLGRISESPTNSLTRQSLESEGSGDKEYPDTTVINTMDTTELIERLKVLSEVSPTRSGRSSPNPFASQRMQYDFEPIEDPSDLNRCFSPIITIENPTPDNISSQVSYDAFGIETIAERNNLKTSDNKKGESISRETSIGSASDIWTEDGSALPTFRSKCRRSSSGASGQSEESSNYSSEDDSRSKGKDIQRINSFQSGKSVDSGLPDIHETNEEDMAAKQGAVACNCPASSESLLGLFLGNDSQPESVHDRRDHVDRSDSGVVKDKENQGLSFSDSGVKATGSGDVNCDHKSPVARRRSSAYDRMVQCEECKKLCPIENFSREIDRICGKCHSKRTERKEAVIELIQTEINYGQDLRILKEEFYNPMKSGGILSQDNLAAMFLNLQELIDVNSKLCVTLQDGLESCKACKDRELATLEVGQVFLDNVEFFQAYEIFCVKQRQSVELMENLQRKSELLRIFLQVSSKQNSKLRKMDLKSFLTMPVQRIMKYPLLLNRIYRATPKEHPDRESIRQARRKIEEQIARINEISMGRPPKLRKAKSTTALNRTESIEGHQLAKLSAELLDWKPEEAQAIMFETLQVGSCELIGVPNWNRKSLKKGVAVQVLLCAQGAGEYSNLNLDQGLCHQHGFNFSGQSEAIEAAVILLKKKSGNKFTLYKEPILLSTCILSRRDDILDAFEITPMFKESYTFQVFHASGNPELEDHLDDAAQKLVFITGENAEDSNICNKWFDHLYFFCKDLGTWRKRRMGMANIMIPTMS